ACVRVAARLPIVGRWLRVDPLKVREMERAIGALMQRPAALAPVALLEISAQVLLVCEVYWAIRSMGVAVPVSSALLAEVMSRAFTLVEFVGATEMGFAVLFTWLGMPAAIGVTLSLIKTLRSLTAAGSTIGIAKATARANPLLAARPPVGTAVPDSGG